MVRWEKIGKILPLRRDIKWLRSLAGASFACQSQDNPHIFDLFVTGMAINRRSLIGIVKLDMRQLKIIEVASTPVMKLGIRGTFDEDGTSYPYIVKFEDKYLMYYTGWVRSVSVPWMNGLGLAISNNGVSFKRYSRAPIIHRDDKDYIGIGSSCVLRDEEGFKMWYTRFDRWGKNPTDHKHHYNIKYAESNDGINWVKYNSICIGFKDKSEYAIAKPCVMKLYGKYLMWYSYRGNFYKIGFAISDDGVSWTRKDHLAGISVSEHGWDSEMICYPFVFPYEKFLYMLYNGNGYGASGLGLARIELKQIMEVL